MRVHLKLEHAIGVRHDSSVFLQPGENIFDGSTLHDNELEFLRALEKDGLVEITEIAPATPEARKGKPRRVAQGA